MKNQNRSQEEQFTDRLKYHFKQFPQASEYFHLKKIGNIMNRLETTSEKEFNTFRVQRPLVGFQLTDKDICLLSSNAKAQRGLPIGLDLVEMLGSIKPTQGTTPKRETLHGDKTGSDRSMSTWRCGLREKIFTKGILIGFFFTITGLWALRTIYRMVT